MRRTIYDAARTCTAAGLSVLPVRAADKLPYAALLPRDPAGRPVWAPFQQRIAGDDLLRRWFLQHDASLAVVCGRVSGNLEVLDFDHHPPDWEQVCELWAGLVDSQAPGLVDRLVIAETQHGGRHVFYRCPRIAGNRKLSLYPTHDAAGRPTRGALIESRGEGGYVLVAPSPGYRLRQGSLDAIPTITVEERELLHAAARAFQAVADVVSGPSPRRAELRSGGAGKAGEASRPSTGSGREPSLPAVAQGENLRSAPSLGMTGGGQAADCGAALRPGDDYNARATPADVAGLLARHGWAEVHRRGDVTYWRRPGKERGWSATLNHIPGKLYVFSANAHPFAPDRAYAPFAIYALLEHGGNWRAAARGLARAGYGRRRNDGNADNADGYGSKRNADGAENADPADRPASSSSKHGASASSASSASSAFHSDLPEIVVTNRPLPDISAEALAALHAANDPPYLFVRGGGLVRVRTDERGRLVLDDAAAAILRGRMARSSFWYRAGPDGDLRHITPPEPAVEDILALGAWPFPPLEGVIQAPVLRPDGTILDQPGYDPATALFYAPAPGLELPAVPDAPCPGDVQAALALVDEAIGEFPYADQASRANTWALLLTPLLRPAIAGCTPLALIDKPQAGTGASLLAELVSLLATGRAAAMMAAPDNEEEWRKRITAALAEGATVLTIDNVEGVLGSPALAAALTSTSWRDRLLGQNRLVDLPQRATWLATGNNLRLGGDLPRRCYWIRLNARTSEPWRRRRFRHPGLLPWARGRRGALLAALLTVARSWWAAGCPQADAPQLGGFEAWAAAIAGILEHAGVPGFLANLDDLYRRADDEGAQWQAFLTAWHAALGDDPLTAAELVERLRAAAQDGASEAERDLVHALPDAFADSLHDARRGAGFTRALGRALAKRAEMVFDDTGLCLVRIRVANSNNATRWCVRRGDGTGFRD